MSAEAFELLVTTHFQAVRRFVQKRVRTLDQADDIVQQTFLRAFVFRHQLRSPSRFKSWVWTIALNEVRMFHRASRPNVSLEDSPSSYLADSAPSPLTICERSQDRERLQAGMASLTPRDRTAIQLADLRGLKATDAANAMAISVPAFKSVQFRARQRLGNALRSGQSKSARRMAA